MHSTHEAGFTESTRRALEEAAYDLIRRHGFEATTAAAIAAQAGFTERTFFRYFHEKEDVVFSPLESRFDDYLPHLERHLSGGGLSVDALLRAFAEADQQHLARRELMLRFFELIRANPSLERRLAYHSRWFTDHTTRAVAAILGRDPQELSVRVVVAVTVSILTTATQHWLDTGRQAPIEKHVAQAARLVGTELDARGCPQPT